jgi:uncharacterized protein RhaS with RHS repeats
MAETGLNQNVNRDYDPLTGRYIESDPIGLNGGSDSTYSYVNENPLWFADSTGLLAPSPGFWPTLGAATAEGITEGAEVGAEAGTVAEPGGGTAIGAVAGAAIGGIAGVGVGIYEACKNPDDCSALYARIDATVNRLKRRYYQLLANELNLPPSGPFSVGTHQSQFSNEQLGLRRLLYQANARGCLAYNPDAWTWATRPAPSPLPNIAGR